LKAADNPVLQNIWDIVAMIPHGRVSTYGNVARAAGLARGARQAGYAMSSPQHREQARRLRAEGVAVKGGRVDSSAIVDLDEL